MQRGVGQRGCRWMPGTSLSEMQVSAGHVGDRETWRQCLVALQDPNDPVMWALPTRTTSRPPELRTSGVPTQSEDLETPKKGRGEEAVGEGSEHRSHGSVLVLGAQDTCTDEGAIAATPKTSRSPSCPLSPMVDSLPGTVSSTGGADVAVELASLSQEIDSDGENERTGLL